MAISIESPALKSVSVLVADPQPLIRESLAALLESGRYKVIGQCEDGEEAFRAHPERDIG